MNVVRNRGRMMVSSGLLARAARVVGLSPDASPWRVVAVLMVVVLAAAGFGAVGTPGAPGGQVRPEAAVASPAEVPVAGLTRAAPVRLVIPAIDVDVEVVPLGFRDGELAAVPAGAVAGWYERGTSPGELGSAVILGRVSDGRSEAALAGLDQLVDGDRIEVVRADGLTAEFEVDRVQPFSTDRYRQHDGRAKLRLVGIAGDEPERRPGLVVFARLRA